MSSAIRTRIPSILYLILSLSGFSLSLIGGIGFLVFGLLQSQSNTPGSLLYSTLVIGWGSLLMASLLIPGLALAVRRLLHDIPDQGYKTDRGWTILPAVALWGILLGIGALVYQKPGLCWFILPLITPLLISMAFLIWQKLGSNKRWAKNKQTVWSLIGVNILVTPTLIIIIEMILLIVMGTLIGIIIVTNPDTLQQFKVLILELQQTSPTITPEELQEMLKVFLNNPWIVSSIFFMMSFLIPLAEEFFKPIWLWFFKKDITPTQGYFYGLISGGAFGLFESIGYMVNTTNDQWLIMAASRSLTVLLHMVTSGLTGWGMAKAWRTHRFAPAIQTFLAAVLIHGIWNFFGIISGFAEIIQPANMLNQTLLALSPASSYIIGTLAVGILATLIGFRLSLSHQK